MLYLVDTKGVYDPEIISVMAAAFAEVCQFLPKTAAGNDEVRQQCASKILGFVDHGQRDPALLSELTLDAMAETRCRASAIPKYFRMTV